MIVTPKIIENIRPNQVSNTIQINLTYLQMLMFGEVDITHITPELYTSQAGNCVSIVGPHDIRQR